MEKIQLSVTEWERWAERTRKEFIYVRNDYLTEFCWWHNLTSVSEIKTKLEDGEKTGCRPDDFRKITLSQHSFLDELWSLWPEIEGNKAIFIRNKCINYKKVTLNPHDDRLCQKLEEGEHEGKGLYDFTKLYACSFGPFSIEDFAKSEFKILWILREPTLTIDDLTGFSSGRESCLGGIDLAKSYYDTQWGKMGKKPINEEHRTISALINTSKMILEENSHLLTHSADKSEDNILKEVMNHVAVMYINKFPGLALSSCENDFTLLKAWSLRNKDEIDSLIKDFEIRIVVGEADTLPFFCNDENLFTGLKKMSLEKYKNKSSLSPTLLSNDIIDSLSLLKGIALDSRNTKWFCWRLPCFSSDKEKSSLSQAIKESLRMWDM